MESFMMILDFRKQESKSAAETSATEKPAELHDQSETISHTIENNTLSTLDARDIERGATDETLIAAVPTELHIQLETPKYTMKDCMKTFDARRINSIEDDEKLTPVDPAGLYVQLKTLKRTMKKSVMRTFDARKLEPLRNDETVITAEPIELYARSETLEFPPGTKIPPDAGIARVMVNISDEELKLLGIHVADLPYNTKEPYAHWHFVGRVVSRSLFHTSGELMLLAAWQRDDEKGEILGFWTGWRKNSDEGSSKTINVTFHRNSLTESPILQCEVE